jgi:hypothetical protein
MPGGYVFRQMASNRAGECSKTARWRSGDDPGLPRDSPSEAGGSSFRPRRSPLSNEPNTGAWNEAPAYDGQPNDRGAKESANDGVALKRPMAIADSNLMACMFGPPGPDANRRTAGCDHPAIGTVERAI